MQINDLVIIKNDINKTLFKIIYIKEEKFYLKGYNYRIFIIKNREEIIPAPKEVIEIEKNKDLYYSKKIKKTKQIRNKKIIYGRILHIDGDKEYLNNCLELYKEMGIYAQGIYIKEKEIPNKIENIITQTTPDIIVITGHDYFNGKDIKDINNYENTKYYIETVRKIRQKYLGNISIIVGACCSHFEALIGAGADFASSPKRINIHTYDPAVIAITIASTSINKNVDFNQCLKLIENGNKAFGGIETKGKMKLLL